MRKDTKNTQKEPWVVFTDPTGKELCAYTVRGTFSEEYIETQKLIAAENGLQVKDVLANIVLR